MKWIEVIQHGINSRAERQTLANGTSGPEFIGEHHLREIWRNFYSEHALNLPDVPKDLLSAKKWILGPEDAKRKLGERHGVLLFASIFVVINWVHWDLFLPMFVKDNKLMLDDRWLPLKRDQNVVDLDTFETAFINTQHMFIPPYIINQGQVLVSTNDRLPFLKEETPLHPLDPTESLKVQKVKIAASYFVLKDGSGKRAANYARKQCERAEADIMRKLREGLQPHSRIAKILCSLDCPPNHFSILMHWADGDDLDVRLHKLSIVNPAASMTGLNLDETSLQKAIITEMANLIHAVSHLHSKKVGNVPCYHMDLKPRNILVYYDGYPNDLVGRWKIADFGLSVFHKRETLGQDASQTPAKRPKGEFQPPEADEDWSRELGRPKGINSQGDIWSIGAILCLVLAYALNKVEGVRQLDSKRSKTATGKVAEDPFFYTLSKIDHKPRLKTSIEIWLYQITQEHEETWVQALVACILKCLRITAKDRPSADQLYEDIKTQVIAKMGTNSADFDSNSIQSPASGPQVPPETRISTPRESSRLEQLDSSPSNQSQSFEQTSVIETSRSMSREHPLPSDPPFPLETLVYPAPPPSLYLSALKTEYKVSYCPIEAYIVVLQATHATLLRPERQYADPGEEADHFTGKFGDAILRWPYMALITAGGEKVNFICCDHEARKLPSSLGNNNDQAFPSEDSIAMSTDGEIVVMMTSQCLRLHDSTRMGYLEYQMNPGQYEGFQKICFALNNEALLACGWKHFFVWDKVAPSWGQSWEINKDKPYKKRYPQLSPNNRAPNHIIIPFRQRKAFILHNGSGFFGVFIREDGLSVSEVIYSASILCGAIATDDCSVYYVRKTEDGFIRKQTHLVLCQRSLTDLRIGDERELYPLDEIRHKSKVSAKMMIRQMPSSDHLYIFASGNQTLVFNLTRRPELPVTRPTRHHPRTHSGGGLGIRPSS